MLSDPDFMKYCSECWNNSQKACTLRTLLISSTGNIAGSITTELRNADSDESGHFTCLSCCRYSSIVAFSALLSNMMTQCMTPAIESHISTIETQTDIWKFLNNWKYQLAREDVNLEVFYIFNPNHQTLPLRLDWKFQFIIADVIQPPNPAVCRGVQVLQFLDFHWRLMVQYCSIVASSSSRVFFLTSISFVFDWFDQVSRVQLLLWTCSHCFVFVCLCIVVGLIRSYILLYSIVFSLVVCLLTFFPFTYLPKFIFAIATPLFSLVSFLIYLSFGSFQNTSSWTAENELLMTVCSATNAQKSFETKMQRFITHAAFINQLSLSPFHPVNKLTLCSQEFQKPKKYFVRTECLCVTATQLSQHLLAWSLTQKVAMSRLRVPRHELHFILMFYRFKSFCKLCGCFWWL